MAETDAGAGTARIDLLTIVGLALLLNPLLTMWHEIGGHAAACAALGGTVATIGAFYVQCTGLTGLPDMAVACAGVAVNTVLAIVAYAVWRGARRDRARLFWWFVWVSEAFVAAGYFCFSDISGVGDLGVARGGGLAGAPMPIAWRIGEMAFGIAVYWLLIGRASAALGRMIGAGELVAGSRRRIAHGYYFASGAIAILVGLLNPVGIFVTILSAAASSFGGLAGFISIGFARPAGAPANSFTIARWWPVIITGAATSALFALLLGPSLHFASPVA